MSTSDETLDGRVPRHTQDFSIPTLILLWIFAFAIGILFRYLLSLSYLLS